MRAPSLWSPGFCRARVAQVGPMYHGAGRLEKGGGSVNKSVRADVEVGVMLRFLLCVTLLAVGLRASAAPTPSALWSFGAGSRATSHPAVGTTGLIAFATEKGVVVLDERGALVRRVDALPTHQPFWDGDKLWVLTKAGWVREGEEGGCAAHGMRPTLTPTGELLQAGERALFLCDEPVQSRKGRAGEMFVLRDGYVAADAWWIEFFGADFTPRGSVRVAEAGAAAGVDEQGRLLVLGADGQLRTLDETGQLSGGVPGDGGPPLVGASGVVVLGSRAVSVVSEGAVRWTLPIAAGVRQAAVLEGGHVAVLERTGRIGLIQDGKPVWARRLSDPGQFFGAHPAGLLLVETGGKIVAWRAPPPEAGALVPVHRGLDRSGRIPMDVKEALPPPPCRHGRCALRNARVWDEPERAGAQ